LIDLKLAVFLHRQLAARNRWLLFSYCFT